MSEYGVTSTGFVPKRLDVITNEIHEELSEKWGFNTRQNTQSVINVIVTNFADRIAELWEVAQEIYNSMYPFSAEGISLDNAVQFGGISRSEARSTVYPIHCECTDGTAIPKGTQIRSITNPKVEFQTTADSVVSRSAFNSIRITTSALQPDTDYTVIIDGLTYSVHSLANPTVETILSALENAIDSSQFNATYNNEALEISSSSIDERHNMTLSPNLTTESVTGIVNFSSLDVGDVDLPNNTITEIKTAIPGLTSVVNLMPRIAGNLRETDAQLRASYVEKMFQRSSRMNDSIKSAILQNVQGVSFCNVQDNDSDEYDEYGRPPHSIEAIVEGGNDTEIASQILNTKAGGISSFGNTEVDLTLNGGESLAIRFTRPTYIYVWFKVIVTPLGSLSLDYEDIIKTIITAGVSNTGNINEIVPQSFIGDMYRNIANIGHIEILAFCTDSPSDSPTSYTEAPIPVTLRKKAVTDAKRIEVILSA